MEFCSSFDIVCIVSMFFLLLNIMTCCFIAWVIIKADFDLEMDETKKERRLKGEEERERGERNEMDDKL